MMKTTNFEIDTPFAKFNFISLALNLLSFVMTFLFDQTDNLNYKIFSLGIALHIFLLVVSFVDYGLKVKKIHNISGIYLQSLMFWIPILEALIFVNIEFRYYLFLKEDQWMSYVKFLYYFLKFIIICLKYIQSIAFAIFYNTLFLLIILINLGLVFGLENYFLLSFFFDILVLMYTLRIFFKNFEKILNNRAKIMELSLNAIDDFIAIIQDKTRLNKIEREPFQIYFHNENILNIFEVKKFLKNPISFKDLDNKLMNFKLEKNKETHLVESETRIKTNEKGKTFKTLTDILIFYNSFENISLTMTFLNSDEPNSNINLIERTERRKRKSIIYQTNLKLILKKITIENKNYFIIQIKIIENNFGKNEVRETKMRILSTISHELKTPLNASLCLLELLKEDDDEETRNLYLDNCTASLKILENTLNNLIDYSLILSEQMILSLSKVDLNNLMQEIFLTTKSQILMKNLDYSIEIHGSLVHKKVFTDLNRLKQILLNIVLNSIQFTNKGFIKIDINTISSQPPTIGFTIQDSGIGMDNLFCLNLIRKINDESFDFNANTTGSCMGLTLSNKLAFLLGEKGLQIDTIHNEGTTIKFSIVDQNLLLSSVEPKGHINISEFEKNSLSSIREFSLKIENILRRNKSIKLDFQDSSSIHESEIEEIAIPLVSSDRRNNAMLKNINSHNFDEIKKPTLWCDLPSNENPLKTFLSLKKTLSQPLEKPNRRKISLSFLSPPMEPGNSNIIKKKMDYSLWGIEDENSQKNNNNNIITKNMSWSLHSKEFNNTSILKRQIINCDDSPHGFNRCKISNFNETLNNYKVIEPRVEDCHCEKILIVDDDPFNILSLELLLKSYNISSSQAMNGKDAIEKAKFHRCLSDKCTGFKLIFMDYQMPVMDGVETTKTLMEMAQKKEISKVVIIGCTAFTTKDQVTNCLDAGMKDVIFKPLSKEILGNILKEWYIK